MPILKKIFSEKYVLWITAVTCIFHTVLSLVHYFLSVSDLYSLDYTLILISLAAWLTHFVVYREKPHFGKGSIILTIMFVWLLLSCQIMTDTYGRNWFSYNKDKLYDTLLLFGLIFPLGKYMAKKGFDVFVRILINALVFIWTGFVVYILIHVFQNKIIVTPSGGQIGMSSKVALVLNTHYNTTGVIQLVMVIMLMYLIFISRRSIAFTAAYVIACFINMIALVLSNSRTSFYAVLIIFAAFIFSSIYNSKWDLSQRKKILVGVAAAVMTVLMVLLFRNIVFTVHENTTHLKARLIAQSGAQSSAIDSAESAARDLTSTRTIGKRALIWKRALKLMTTDARHFLFGVTPFYIVEALNEASGGIGEQNVYTHNQFLEVGVALGFPGMICFILFVVYLAVYAYRITIRQNMGLQAWLVSSIVVTLLIANLTEATLMFYRWISSYVFFFFCGWIYGTTEQRNKIITGKKPKK